MFLTWLKAENFRNHASLNLKFTNGINCFIGNNAMGKTNILEAIYYLATLASFRAAKDEDLIRWGKEAFSLLAEINSFSHTKVLHIKVSGENKAYFINQAKKSRSTEFIGQIKTTFFSPEDLSLIKGSPVFRRRFLDHFLSQLFPSYHHHLLKLKKIIREKNILLREAKIKNNFDISLLDVYDEQLAYVSAWIMLKRINILKKLLPAAKVIHAKINPDEELNIKYQSCVPFNSDDIIFEKLKSLYFSAITSIRAQEMMKKASLLGPQRDDIIITVNEKILKEFGSQGQQRTATIALKLAQAEVFKKELEENPIILLDDIFSELDEKRRKNILELLDKETQVFITATDENLIPDSFRKHAKIYFLTKEGIKEK